MKKVIVICGICFVVLFNLTAGMSAYAQDWPMRLYDIRRGGITAESLNLPLTQTWVHNARPPSSAWTEHPHRDYWGGEYKPRQGFDYCLDVAVVDGFVYFGSSRTGAITCLNSSTSDEVWKYYTDGPVRLAPLVTNGKVYVGSDDGYAYCLNAANGAEVWKVRAGPTDEMIWGNEHMISVWPIRSSLLVDGSDVFWAAGLLKEEGMYICKRNAADGTGGWTVTAEKSPQGYILATPTQLFVPTGKTYPTVYSRSDGSFVGYVRYQNDYAYRDGGCWAILTPDVADIWNGPTVNDTAQQFNANTRTLIATVAGANYLIADSTYAYYNTDSQIIKINRSDRSPVWSRGYIYPYSIIKAGSRLYAGGDGSIGAIDTSNGDRPWTAAVSGKVYGLAAADGKLYVSTDEGLIYCFSESP